MNILDETCRNWLPWPCSISRPSQLPYYWGVGVSYGYLKRMGGSASRKTANSPQPWRRPVKRRKRPWFVTSLVGSNLRMVIINNCLQHVSYTTKSCQLDPIGYSIVFTRTQTCVNSVYFIAHFIHGGWDLHGESFAEASVESVRVIIVSRKPGASWKPCGSEELGAAPRKPHGSSCGSFVLRQCKIKRD